MFSNPWRNERGDRKEIPGELSVLFADFVIYITQELWYTFFKWTPSVGGTARSSEFLIDNNRLQV